jgi:hypothetical protein
MAKKILKGVGKVAKLAIGGLIGSSLMSKSKKADTPAEPDGPIVMPLADDDKIKAAKRRAIATQMQRGGRSSTLLTGDSDTLGG